MEKANVASRANSVSATGVRWPASGQIVFGADCYSPRIGERRNDNHAVDRITAEIDDGAGNHIRLEGKVPSQCRVPTTDEADRQTAFGSAVMAAVTTWRLRSAASAASRLRVLVRT